ncbi:MAG: hypothetical protein ABIK31_07815 [candidate division WOR-3 bacterium]
MAVEKIKYDSSWSDITPTGLNGLANNSSVNTNAIDNTSNQVLDYEFEYGYKYDTNPTANNTIELTIEFSSDGTNWTDKDNYSQNIILTADTSNHRKRFSVTEIVSSANYSPSYFRIKITNKGGVAFGSSGNYLKIRKVWREIV